MPNDRAAFSSARFSARPGVGGFLAEPAGPATGPQTTPAKMFGHDMMFHEHRKLAYPIEAAASGVISADLAANQPSVILDLDACALSDLIAARGVSCVEVATAYLDHIERTNPFFNAIVSIRDREEILIEAREKDALLARGTRQGWLHGFPQAIKDLASTKGLRTTLGSPLHRDSIPPRDAVFVQRIKRSGAIIVGKTNTAEFGLGSQTYNPVFGTTFNAYDRSRTSGGSSGGAAVALATRMLPVADGSDNAGSIRNPAAYNNLFSMRPTQGLMPPEGRDPYLPSFGTVGPMARSVEDLALLYSVQADDQTWPQPSAEQAADGFRRRLTRDLRGKRIGWLGDLDGYLAFEPGVIDLCLRALQSFVAIGCEVEPVSIAYPLDALWQDWVTLRAWLTGGPLAARYADPRRRALMKPEACWEVEQAMRLSAMDVLEASGRRADFCRAVARLFEIHDFLVLPTAQCFPFDATVHWPKEIGGRQMDTYHRWMEVVSYATLAGCPVVNVPAGFSAQGLPMGLQILAPCHRDLACLELAHAYEQASGWNAIRPSESSWKREDLPDGCACA
jgi:amidase